MFNYSKQNITKNDIKEVINVLNSEYITQGNIVNKFESKLSQYTKSKYCMVVNNGTAALHLAGIALNWKKNDIVLTTPITFLSTANAILYNNANVDFVDINLVNYCIDVNKLEDKLKFYKNKNTKIKSLIVVDYAGHPADWESISYLSKKYNFSTINDNCHALGASFKKDKGYSTKYADIAVQSFHPVKNITTGEGGAILTNKLNLFKKIKMLRSHGMEKNKRIMRKGLWQYEMRNLGYNYRLTDFQCALGISQLDNLDKSLKKKNYIYKFYYNYFKNYDHIIPPVTKNNVSNGFHLYPLLVDFKKNSEKILFFKKMMSKNIKLQVHYIPIYRQPFYKKRYDFNYSDFPNSEKFYKKVISIPFYFDLNLKDLRYISKTIVDLSK